MYRLLYREKHIIYGARLFLIANICMSLNGLVL